MFSYIYLYNNEILLQKIGITRSNPDKIQQEKQQEAYRKRELHQAKEKQRKHIWHIKNR